MLIAAIDKTLPSPYSRATMFYTLRVAFEFHCMPFVTCPQHVLQCANDDTRIWHRPFRSFPFNRVEAELWSWMDLKD